MKSIVELREEWEGLKSAGFYNHTMSAGPVGCVAQFGSSEWYEVQFDAYVANNRATEHYDDLKKGANPNCPQCKGDGYLPIGIQGPYLQTCSCVGRPVIEEVLSR